MRHHSSIHRRNAQGFSLIELLVTIGLITLLVGITYPFISAVTSGSRVQAGLNIAGMSADVARQWVQAESWANDGSTTAPTLEKYNGTAALFCPTGEVRIVKNDRNARASSGTPTYLEDRGPNPGDSVNGYRDLDQVDYILIPNGVGIAGIDRFGNGTDDVRFIAPPFAIAFNELGQLNYGNDGEIYYDADDNGTYNLSSTRPAGYNFRDWEGLPGDNNEDEITNKLKKALPFEVIECVPGVIVYSLDDFRGAGFDFNGGGEIEPGDTDAWNWIKENGEAIFFSPHTGVALRDEQE